MLDLFDWRPAPAYPAVPGARAMDTSKAAAEAIKPDAGRLRALTLCAIQGAGSVGLTADEAAEKVLFCSILSIRPRCTELQALGKIKDSGQRRANASGRKAIVWVAA
jgi:hypothetical protein